MGIVEIVSCAAMGVISLSMIICAIAFAVDVYAGVNSLRNDDKGRES